MDRLSPLCSPCPRRILRLLELFLILTLLTTLCETDCNSMHARANGMNLICCSAKQPVVDSCEYSSLCSAETCECQLHVGTDLSCELQEIQVIELGRPTFPSELLPKLLLCERTVDILEGYQREQIENGGIDDDINSLQSTFVWRDHHQHRGKLSCTTLHLPNREHPYRVFVHHWNDTLTPSLFTGLAKANVTELKIYDVGETTSSIELAKYFPHLMSLEISARSHKPVDISSTFHHLRLLESLKISNVNLRFSRTASSWVKVISHIHIDNSSLIDLPPWLGLAKRLRTINVKIFAAAKMDESVVSTVKTISLNNGRDVSSVAAHTFALCSELRVLDLSYNPIDSLPHRCFSRNAKLKWLKLSATKIKVLSPESFVGLAALKSLTLSYSPLHSIAHYAFLPLKSLKTLDLEGTNISSIPPAVTQNCGLTHLNVANNMLHLHSSLPAEVMALLSGLSLLKLDGNPLTEFPPSLFLLSTDNFRLIRQLVQTMTSLPVWTEDPCAPYYWALHLRNRSLSFRILVTTWNEKRMEREGLSYCRERYELMVEGLDIYRDLEKSSGCSVNRRLRSPALVKATKVVCVTNTTATPDNYGIPALYEDRQDLSNLLWASLMANAVFLCLMIAIICLVMSSHGKSKMNH